MNVKKMSDNELRTKLENIESLILGNIWSTFTESRLEEGRKIANELSRRQALRKLRLQLKWNTDMLKVPFSKRPRGSRFKLNNSFILDDQKSIMKDLAYERRLPKDKRTFILQVD